MNASACSACPAAALRSAPRSDTCAPLRAQHAATHHGCFPGVHVGYHAHFAHAGARQLNGRQICVPRAAKRCVRARAAAREPRAARANGDDAQDAPARGVHGARHDAHDAHGAAAVDQTHAAVHLAGSAGQSALSTTAAVRLAARRAANAPSLSPTPRLRRRIRAARPGWPAARRGRVSTCGGKLTMRCDGLPTPQKTAMFLKRDAGAAAAPTSAAMGRSVAVCVAWPVQFSCALPPRDEMRKQAAKCR